MKNIEIVRNIDLKYVLDHDGTEVPTMDRIKKAFEKTGLYRFDDERSSDSFGIFSLNATGVRKYFKDIPEIDEHECALRVMLPGRFYHPNTFVVETPSRSFSGECVLIGDNLYCIGIPFRQLIPGRNSIPVLWVYGDSFEYTNGDSANT